MASDCARQLRRDMTDAERCLWKHLRAHRFADEKFRRQVPMGPYIVNFVSHRSRLIVELDGGQHAVQVEQDCQRTRWLESRGDRVIRFWNNQVLTVTEPVLEAIALAARTLCLTSIALKESSSNGSRTVNRPLPLLEMVGVKVDYARERGDRLRPAPLTPALG